MNQPPGGFFPPDDPYGGSGKKGGTIPGGPPPEIGNQGAPGPMPTMIDQPVPPIAGGVTPAPGGPFPGAPARPATVAGPIGYAPSYGSRTRPRKSPWGVVIGVGLLGLLFIGGASAAVYVVRARSASTDNDPPLINVDTPPVVDVTPTGNTTDDPGLTPPIDTAGDIATADTTPPAVTPPPTTTSTAKPPSTSTAKPPTTTTSTGTGTTPPPPRVPPTATTTAPPATTTAPPATTTAPPITTATTPQRRWPPIVIRPPAGTSTGTTTTPPPTSTSTGTTPPRWKIPHVQPKRPGNR